MSVLLGPSLFPVIPMRAQFVSCFVVGFLLGISRLQVLQLSGIRAHAPLSTRLGANIWVQKNLIIWSMYTLTFISCHIGHLNIIDDMAKNGDLSFDCADLDATIA